MLLFDIAQTYIKNKYDNNTQDAELEFILPHLVTIIKIRIGGKI
jgi:hypothetical protein